MIHIDILYLLLAWWRVAWCRCQPLHAVLSLPARNFCPFHFKVPLFVPFFYSAPTSPLLLRVLPSPAPCAPFQCLSCLPTLFSNSLLIRGLLKRKKYLITMPHATQDCACLRYHSSGGCNDLRMPLIVSNRQYKILAYL
jgi:hypothetical protein